MVKESRGFILDNAAAASFTLNDCYGFLTARRHVLLLSDLAKNLCESIPWDTFQTIPSNISSEAYYSGIQKRFFRMLLCWTQAPKSLLCSLLADTMNADFIIQVQGTV